MAGRIDETWDPLAGALEPKAERYRRVREADNILGSYFRASDLLAEALQNAADAVDQRGDQGTSEAPPRKIELAFDAGEEWFSVSDTGTGMSRAALDIVFQPNITLKAGPLSSTPTRSWRGEKGVGLSFLLFACDHLQIRTCDGTNRYDALIENAAAWARETDSSPEITSKLTVMDPDSHLGSDRYTVVTLMNIDQTRLDADLFEMSADEIEWVLRTRTAVGNTAYLFEDLGFDQPEDIEVRLNYQGRTADAVQQRQVPYRYATPEDILVRAETLGISGSITVYDFDDLDGMDAEELRSKLAGSALRYVVAYETSSGKEVAIYVFAIAGDQMNDLMVGLKEHPEVEWVPTEWSGFWVATRDMPTGVPLRGGVLPTRGYEQRTFGLVQLDDLKLDVGRKSLHGRTAEMFKRLLRQSWNEDLRWKIERIPRARQGRGVGALEMERRVRKALKLADLTAEIPFRKVPDRRSAVSAIYHELLGAGDPAIADLHGLTTDLVVDSDVVATNGTPDAVHIVFGVDQADVLKIFDAQRGAAETAGLAVIWEIVSPTDGREDDPVARIDVKPAPTDAPFGATHCIRFDGLGGRDEPLHAVVLTDLVAHSDDDGE